MIDKGQKNTCYAIFVQTAAGIRLCQTLSDVNLLGIASSNAPFVLNRSWPKCNAE